MGQQHQQHHEQKLGMMQDSYSRPAVIWPSSLTLRQKEIADMAAARCISRGAELAVSCVDVAKSGYFM